MHDRCCTNARHATRDTASRCDSGTSARAGRPRSDSRYGMAPAGGGGRLDARGAFRAVHGRVPQMAALGRTESAKANAVETTGADRHNLGRRHRGEHGARSADSRRDTARLGRRTGEIPDHSGGTTAAGVPGRRLPPSRSIHAAGNRDGPKKSRSEDRGRTMEPGSRGYRTPMATEAAPPQKPRRGVPRTDEQHSVRTENRDASRSRKPEPPQRLRRHRESRRRGRMGRTDQRGRNRRT